MSDFTTAPSNKPNVLLSLYKKHVEENLYQEMMKDIQVKVRKAAKDAVAALEGEIQEEYQTHSNKMVVQLTVRGLDNAK